MKGTKTLVKDIKFTDQQLKDFILEVVNAPDCLVDGSDDYLAQKYRQLLPTRDRDIQLLAGTLSWFQDPNHPDPNDPFDQKEAAGMLCRSVMGSLRNRLRSVWLAGYDDVADWRIRMLQRQAHWSTSLEDQRSRNLYPPSPDTPIELAIDWVRRNLLMLHVCRNPECSRPFFVAHRAQQRFCLECVSASQKAHKRRWWRKKKLLKEEPEMKAGATIVRGKRPDTTSSVSERRLKKFLHDIVNAADNRFDYILKVYVDAGFLPSKTLSERAVALNPGFLTTQELTLRRQREMRQVVEQLRNGLQRIWSADDAATAEWRLFSLQNEIYRSADTTMYESGAELQPPPDDRLVYRALGRLRRSLHMLRTCKNPACETPFFIADKGGQTHCSDVCAALAQREYKTQWWREKGPEWRKARRPKAKKSRRPVRQPR